MIFELRYLLQFSMIYQHFMCEISALPIIRLQIRRHQMTMPKIFHAIKFDVLYITTTCRNVYRRCLMLCAARKYDYRRRRRRKNGRAASMAADLHILCAHRRYRIYASGAMRLNLDREIFQPRAANIRLRYLFLTGFSSFSLTRQDVRLLN